MLRGSYGAREAWKEKRSLNWLPKSHVSAHEGHVIGASGWLAKKSGIPTQEASASSAKRFEDGKQRYTVLLEQAKSAGVKGVRVGQKTETIKQKMREHGLTVDSTAFDEEIDFDAGIYDPDLFAEDSMTDTKKAELLAFDRASVRRYDADGRLHIAMTPISKACVNPYIGSEIAYSEELGLDPNKIYYLLRHPDEMAKGASSFNNIQLMALHKMVSADKPEKMIVVGTTGSDANFDGTYLNNSLAVWDQAAIDGIESELVKELSSSYRYRPVMTPGTYEGVPYDGVMTKIVGNHVALVEVGRAGPDVHVHDSDPFMETFDMKKTSRMAIAVRGAVRGHIAPLLATDAALTDLKALVALPKKATLAKDIDRICKAVETKLNGKLAADKAFDRAALAALLKLAADGEPDDEMSEDGEDPDMKQGEDESDEDYAARMKETKDKSAADDPPPFKDKPADPEKEKADKAAADAALKKSIKVAADAAGAEVRKQMNELRDAERLCKPIIGEVAADSAEAVYKLAMDQLGIEHDGVHPSAFSVLIKQAQAAKLAADAAPKTRIASDSADTLTQHTTMFPDSKIPSRG